MWLTCHILVSSVILHFVDSKIATISSRVRPMPGSFQLTLSVCSRGCVNGGFTKKSIWGAPSCKCSPFYQGHCCEDVKCVMNGIPKTEGADCACPPEQRGKFCENVDCGAGRLSLKNDDFFCECPIGYNGTYCENKIVGIDSDMNPGINITGFCYCFAHNGPQLFVLFTLFLAVIGILSICTCTLLVAKRRYRARISTDDSCFTGVYVCTDGPNPPTAKTHKKSQKDDIERRYYAIGYNNVDTSPPRPEKPPTPPPSYHDATGA